MQFSVCTGSAIHAFNCNFVFGKRIDDGIITGRQDCVPSLNACVWAHLWRNSAEPVMTEAEWMLLQLLHFHTFTCLTKRTQMTFPIKEDFQRLCVSNREPATDWMWLRLNCSSTGMTGWIPPQTSERGLLQSLCLLLLPVRTCKNLITLKMNHSNFQLTSPTVPVFVCGVTQAAVAVETRISDVTNVVIAFEKTPIQQPLLLLIVWAKELDGRRGMLGGREGGKQTFRWLFLQTYALILTLPNTIGGGRPPPPPAMQQQEEAHSLKTKFHSVLHNRRRQGGYLGFTTHLFFYYESSDIHHNNVHSGKV